MNNSENQESKKYTSEQNNFENGQSQTEVNELFRQLGDTAPVLIWIADLTKGCFWFNKRWLDFTGRTMEQENGNGWAEGVHPEDLARCLEIYTTSFDARQEFSMEYRLQRYDGEYRWFLDNGVPRFTSDGEFLGFIGSCIDVSEHKKLEVELKEAARRKDEFLATLAHELRNPLAPIRSGLEVIRQNGANHPKFNETLDILERQTNQIVHLVDDLLDISRISQGKIKLRKERIELKVAVEMALETSKALIDEAENELTIALPNEPIFLDADLTRIAQILLNILNNAAKYSRPGGKISLVGSKEENQAQIVIKDTGLGIAPEMIPKIFDMFGQVETSEEQARGGLGIGLSVVRKMVELHGGTVEAFSDGIERGTKFVIRLPLAVEQSESLPASKITEKEIIQTAQMEMPHDTNKINYQQSPKQYRILVVDDNQDAVEMLEALLSMKDHTIRTAINGKTAIEVAQEFQPEICLSDIGLPGMNGYELALRLREMFPQALLISISGWGQEEDRRQSKEAGFNYHLVKPVQFDDLLKLINQRPN